MQTKIYKNIDAAGLAECGALLKAGKIVAFPTETVYGLGASALCESAVSAIFTAKKRPQDNPLIAHISDISMLPMVAREVSDDAMQLFERFSPGPLTVILPKSNSISSLVTAGGDTVAVRCPAHPIANALIRAAGVPIVAPSANLSGKPSPTAFEATFEDLNGLVPAIIDGGECDVGVESTVVLPKGKRLLRLLRPGAITPKMLQQAGFEVEIDPNILSPLDESKPVLSPGMKHRHYAPNAPLTIVKGEKSAVLRFLKEKQLQGAGILCFEGELQGKNVFTYGEQGNAEEQSRKLFSALRKFDKTDVCEIYARCPETEGVGLAVYNRLLRAARFQILEVVE